MPLFIDETRISIALHKRFHTKGEKNDEQQQQRKLTLLRCKPDLQLPNIYCVGSYWNGRIIHAFAVVQVRFRTHKKKKICIVYTISTSKLNN